MNPFGGRSVEPGLLRETLYQDSGLDAAFVALTTASAAIATFGLLENSVAVIIGAMIIAPLLMPIEGISFGVLNGDFFLARRAATTLVVGTLSAVLISYLIGLVFGFVTFGSEVVARTHPTLLDLGIAIFAGAIGGFAKIRRDLSASVAGTAIAVALMPPLCVLGLELSRGGLQLGVGSSLLFVTNVLGITLACMAMYLLGGYADFHLARIRLLGTVGIVLLLAIPLAANLFHLIDQAQVERAVRTSLSRTVTFSRLTVVSLKVNWLSDPPQIDMVVRTDQTVTPKQIGLVEQFVKRQTGRPFHLVVEVARVEEVTSSPLTPESPQPSSLAPYYP